MNRERSEWLTSQQLTNLLMPHGFPSRGSKALCRLCTVHTSQNPVTAAGVVDNCADEGFVFGHGSKPFARRMPSAHTCCSGVSGGSHGLVYRTGENSGPCRMPDPVTVAGRVEPTGCQGQAVLGSLANALPV